jgi:hypothetical protein
VATMIAELYDALVKAGADDVSARSAAVAVADYDRRLADVGLGLQRLETKVEMGFVEVGARFAEARTESDARFNQVHMRLAELRAESDPRFNQVHVRLAELRAEMDTRFAELRRETDTRFVQLDTRFAELRAEMAGVETRITRWFIGVLPAQFAGVLALLVRLGSV